MAPNDAQPADAQTALGPVGSRAFEPRHDAAQARLKDLLLEDDSGKVLERLAAALFGGLLGVRVAVAASGFQHGGDAGPAGSGGRRFRIETKRYAETTSLSERELLGEIDHALSRDKALEAWVLVATREVPEQLRQSLVQKGEERGIPVLIVSWETVGLSSLAALCAFDPDAVRDLVSNSAAEQARVIAEVAQPAIDGLRRDLASWSLGFETLRSASIERLGRIWAEPRSAQADFGQDVAVGAQPRRIRRRRAVTRFDRWLEGGAAAPLVVVGTEGVGKTWAVLDWLHEGRASDTILLMVPSATAPALAASDERSVRGLLAERLLSLARTRDMAHWLRRLDLLMRRPVEEGPVFTLFLDGLNEVPSAPWLQVLKVLQGPAFEGRVRVIVSTRELYFRERLGSLAGLVVPPDRVEVDAYDLQPGGEFDSMLDLEGLTRAEFDPELVELARYPRMFSLAVRLRTRLVGIGGLTVHRLLWEYGRDALGVRAGRSFSEEEWRDWLSEVARRWRQGAVPGDARALTGTFERGDLTYDEVRSRLSDIIDGRFAAGRSGGVALSPAIVSHALGALLLEQLSSSACHRIDELADELARWLEPISGLDQRAEILRAGVSIGIERRPPADDAVLGVLVTAWLQSQNLDERHHRDASRLGRELVVPLLDAIERSDQPGQRIARSIALDALRSLPRSDELALRAIQARGIEWLRFVARSMFPPSIEEQDARARERLTRIIGADGDGPVTALGVDLVIVPHAAGVSTLLPSLLEGFPLATVTRLFEVAALNLAVGGRNDAWDGLGWLCLLNEADPSETGDALRAASRAVLGRATEPHVNPMLAGRVAALLLRLTGSEVDEAEAVRIEPRLEHGLEYEKDYLHDPGRSVFALEMRHGAAVLSDPAVTFGAKVTRAANLLLDPTFDLPQPFADDCRRALEHLDPASLGRSAGTSIDDNRFEVWQPALARVDASLLAAFGRRKLHALASAVPDERHWASVHATEQYLLCDKDASTAAHALRLSTRAGDPTYEAFAAGRMLLLELTGLAAWDQACVLLEADLAFVSIEMEQVVEPLDEAGIDALLARYGTGTADQCRTILILISLTGTPLSNRAWSWVEALVDATEGDMQGFAYEILATKDARRWGVTLMRRGWSWSPSHHAWQNHWGSIAVAEASRSTPFEEVSLLLAPSSLLSAVRIRGWDPAEVRMAAEVLDGVIRRDLMVPDLGVDASFDCAPTCSRPHDYVLEPRPLDSGSEIAQRTLGSPTDTESAGDPSRVAQTGRDRILGLMAQGAALYLAEVDVDGLTEVLIRAPDLVEGWLEGCEAATPSFVRRVRLAESTFLALCEALLALSPSRGVTLWRSLRTTLRTRFLGRGGVDEMLHMAFRAPESSEASALLDSLMAPKAAPCDRDLADLVLAAELNGRAAWLDDWYDRDEASTSAWRRRRAVVMQGFRSGADLPVAEAWPAGPVRTTFEALRVASARNRWRDACARHWWKRFATAEDVESAYAAWVLYQASSDNRDAVWLAAHPLRRQSRLDRLKAAHVALNEGSLRRRGDKLVKARTETLYNRRIWRGIAPWLT